MPALIQKVRRALVSLGALAVTVTAAGCAPTATFGNYNAYAENECEDAVTAERADGSLYVGGVKTYLGPDAVVEGTWTAEPGGTSDYFEWTCTINGSQVSVVFADAPQGPCCEEPTPLPIPRAFGGAGGDLAATDGSAPAEPLPTEPLPVGPADGCVIKGNVSYNTGELIYHVPGGAWYDAATVNPDFGEQWFCSEDEAVAAGWRKSYE